ncbi:MAG: HAMP domain-containing sensor histidine kinase [Oscillospiraceae bacterium]
MIQSNDKVLKLKEIYDNENLAVFLCNLDFKIIEINDFIIKNNIAIKIGDLAKTFSVENAHVFILALEKLKKGIPYSNAEFTFCMKKSAVFMLPIMKDGCLDSIVCCMDFEKDCFNIVDIKDVPVRVYQNFCDPLIAVLNDLTPIARRLDMLEQYDELVHLNDAVRHCYKMLRTCESLVNYYELINNQVDFNFKAVSFNYYMEDLVKAIQLIVTREERKIVLNQIDNDIVVELDEKYFSVAIFNLILNSCIFSPKDSQITISISKNNNYASVSIIDEGNGICSRECKNIFLPFYSNVQEIVPYERIGLGLPTVKKIMEKHKGTVMIESVVNKGTCVALNFPIKILESEEKISVKTTIGDYLTDRFSPIYTMFSEIAKVHFY